MDFLELNTVIYFLHPKLVSKVDVFYIKCGKLKSHKMTNVT